jgi:hypothetical protein
LAVGSADRQYVADIGERSKRPYIRNVTYDVKETVKYPKLLECKYEDGNTCMRRRL